MSRVVLTIIGLSLASCQQADQEELKAQLIERRIEERLNQYVAVEEEKCLTSLMSEASEVADSILRANPILIRIDSLQRPPKPSKPLPPLFDRPKDSIVIAPIIDGSTKPDTLDQVQ